MFRPSMEIAEHSPFGTYSATRQTADMVTVIQRRAALRAFMAANAGLKRTPWERASSLSEGTLRAFLTRTDTMTDETYEKLAAGASKLLGRPVKAGELRGDAPLDAHVPIQSYIGAGDEIMPVPGDDPIDYALAPPGMEKAEATEVRGRSMIPLYHAGDLLFHRRVENDPSRFLDHVVAVQVKGGKRFVKLLQRGSRKGRFTLASVNPAFDPLIDQQIEWVGPIEWVRKNVHR